MPLPWVRGHGQASGQRTTLTVAHRLSSVTHCDLIVVMDKGRIVEQGSHAELLRRPGGLYGQMWQAQNGEAEAAALVAARLSGCALDDGDDDDIDTRGGGGGGGGTSSMGDMVAGAGLGLNVGLPGGALGRGVGGGSIRSVSATSFATTAPAPAAAAAIAPTAAAIIAAAAATPFAADAGAASAASSVGAAVASVRRRRVAVARGQASATAEELVDRVLWGSQTAGPAGPSWHMPARPAQAQSAGLGGSVWSIEGRAENSSGDTSNGSRGV